MGERETSYELYQEVLRLRELLELVAQDLEHLAGSDISAEATTLLQRRAMRVRQRLHESRAV